MSQFYKISVPWPVRPPRAQQYAELNESEINVPEFDMDADGKCTQIRLPLTRDLVMVELRQQFHTEVSPVEQPFLRKIAILVLRYTDRIESWLWDRDGDLIQVDSEPLDQPEFDEEEVLIVEEGEVTDRFEMRPEDQELLLLQQQFAHLFRQIGSRGRGES